ncbi:uncharacterized peptidase C1-like protein F26E4.3 [Diadema antillarum]|uniref:uncharacterized peptidase C1-like protein F26E4.3 n=1 Tax=Diadema antillarum TaxID=105358 RepID=UPI003A89D61E
MSLALCALTLLQVLTFTGVVAQYCSVRGCCPGRDDECTTPYFDTLCYCDEFCYLTATDCCPDFRYRCLRVPPPQESRRDICISNGVTYNQGDTIKINCNRCMCRDRGDGIAEFVCEENSCLVESDVINDINYGNFGWRSSNYSFLWGLTQKDGVRYRLGTFSPQAAFASMINVEFDGESGALPKSFDARDRWGGLIGEVMDQGNCGSSWAISTTSVASDRLAIQSEGRERIRLSAQHLLSCNRVQGQLGCGGGNLDRAWWFIRRTGLPSQECYPYRSGMSEDTEMDQLPCRKPYVWSQCPERGVTSAYLRSTPPYVIAPKESDIMQEIYRNGPVQATFKVKKDFFVYRTGVYRHVKSTVAGDESDPNQAGWLSVKIVGWGVDETDPRRPIKYWLVANSWGRSWGEDGMFRIVRGENESDIESYVLGVWMQVHTV